MTKNKQYMLLKNMELPGLTIAAGTVKDEYQWRAVCLCPTFIESASGWFEPVEEVAEPCVQPVDVDFLADWIHEQFNGWQEIKNCWWSFYGTLSSTLLSLVPDLAQRIKGQTPRVSEQEYSDQFEKDLAAIFKDQKQSTGPKHQQLVAIYLDPYDRLSMARGAPPCRIILKLDRPLGHTGDSREQLTGELWVEIPGKGEG